MSAYWRRQLLPPVVRFEFDADQAAELHGELDKLQQALPAGVFLPRIDELVYRLAFDADYLRGTAERGRGGP